MSFPLGKPIMVMIALALITGAGMLARSAPPKKDLTFWVFADQHADTYRSIIGEFEEQTGLSVDIQLLNSRAMPVRLESMFMSGAGTPPLPDVVELEIGWVGRFFLPPVEQIGLLPLNDLLRDSGWQDQVVAGRIAPWSKREVIFGIPHDVHPVSITYRKDLFDEAGVDLESVRTWRELHEGCLEFQAYWRGRGYPHRFAMELPQSAADIVINMLLQRGVDLVDDYDQVYLTDPRVAETVAFYAQLIAGDRRIASESASGAGVWSRDAVEGNFCAFVTPDWKINQFRTYAPQLAGKLRMIPLPKFDPTDTPTSTWGGTMIGITRASPRPADAWKLIEFLYFSNTGLAARQRVTNILPPVISQWDDPAYHRPDPFFAGQKVDELYIDLAKQPPPRKVTPATSIAWVELSVVVNRAVAHVKKFGTDGLEERCRFWTREAAHDLQRRIEHGKARR